MESDLVSALIESAGAGQIAEALARMPGTNLYTLLMGVFAERTKNLAPADIERMYRENRLVAPCPVGQDVLVQADAAAYRVLGTGRFAGIELSPVMPIGVNAVLGGVNQRNILGTTRGCEVFADPTTALTLEAALRRKGMLAQELQNDSSVRLATSARCLRLQRFDNIPGFVPHFKIFALATAGRDVGNEQFELESIEEHLCFHLGYIAALKALGCVIHNVHVYLSDARVMRAIVAYHELDPADIGRKVQVHDSSVFTEYGLAWPRRLEELEMLPRDFVETYDLGKTVVLLEKIEASVLPELRKKYSDLGMTFGIDLDRAAGMNYYTNACFKIWGTNRRGEKYPLADGGFSDWTQKILHSRKERLFTSGIGTELILANFRD